MPEDGSDRTLPPDQLAEMVRVVRPGWHPQKASLADSGWTSLYHLVVETDAGRRRSVLKASPGDDRRDGVDTEARIQAIVDDHTDIPVPTVLGVVDAHDNLRTPYFLMESLPGETISKSEISSLPSGTLWPIARETGRHLGRLHDLDTGLDAFGEWVDHERSEPLEENRLRATPPGCSSPMATSGRRRSSVTGSRRTAEPWRRRGSTTSGRRFSPNSGDG